MPTHRSTSAHAEVFMMRAALGQEHGEMIFAGRHPFAKIAISRPPIGAPGSMLRGSRLEYARKYSSG